MLIDEGWALRNPNSNVRGNTNITRLNPNVDLQAILAHAKSKGVRIWLWAHWADIERQADEAFGLFEKWGIAG